MVSGACRALGEGQWCTRGRGAGLPAARFQLPTLWERQPCHAPHTSPFSYFASAGGFFIILSYLWGWAVDGVRPDTGDWVGSAIAVAGACLAFFWPGR